MRRIEFIKGVTLATAGLSMPFTSYSFRTSIQGTSDFEKRLIPIGRALEEEGYYVWCNSPIEGPDGKIHVYYSRWPKEKGMSGWIHQSEIAHAVADKPEGPYRYVSTILAPRGKGFWDATT